MKSTTKKTSRSYQTPLQGDLRTLAGLALTFASLIALLLLVSCAPKQTDRVYPTVKMDFKTGVEDPDLGLDRLSSATKPLITENQINWSESVDSSRVFRFAENLTKLGVLQSDQAFIKLGDRVGHAFYKARGTTTKSAFKDTLYIKAAIGETKEDVLPIIAKSDAMLAAQIPLIHETIAQVSSRMAWPTAETSPRQALLTAKQFADAFLSRASDSKIDRDVYQGIADTFKKDFYPLLNGLADEVDSVLAEPRSVVMIQRLREIAKKYEFDFGDETNQMLEQAEETMTDIENIQSNQDVLTVIVELWEMTDVENREKTFKPVSEDLYNFLKDKSPKKLRCIKHRGCIDPLIWFSKKLGLLPAIEKQGVQNVKAQISTAAHDGLVKTLQAEVAKFVPSIPAEIETKVAAQLKAIRGKLASVKTDYPGFIHGIASEFEKRNLKDEGDKDNDDVVVAGLETKRVRMSFGSSNIEIARAESNSNSSDITTGGEVIGSSMAYMASLWTAKPDDSITYQKSVLTQVNKMLSLGGFTTPDGKPFPSISLSLDRNHPLTHFNVKDNLSGKTSFAVPDAFAVSDSLSPKVPENTKTVSVRGQAELLRGLAGMVRYFRDWERNSFDESLGAVQIGKLIKDLPAGGVDQKLFPKDTFFALAVGNGAAILQNMTKDLSPVFLIDIKHKTSWANERSDDEDQPAVMAGVVDIVGGKRGTTVSGADSARYLLAIAEFLDATEGIEKTKATPLITPGADGTKPVEMIKSARSQLSMLMVAIANFVSHEMQEKDGGIRPTFDRETVTTDPTAARTANDQATCILALLKASDVLHKPLYEWQALDAYAFMNRKLFNQATGFYSTSEVSKALPAADEIANILLAGEALKSRMSNKSRDQWNLIAAPWTKAFTAF